MRPIARAYRLVLLVASGAATCNQLLSIDEAHVDPTLNMAGASAGGTSSTASGGALGSGGISRAQGGAAHGGDGASAGRVEASAGQGGVDSGKAGQASVGGAAEAGSGGASAGAGGVAQVSLCPEYCSTITQYCTGDVLQYKDMEQCLKICTMLPPGELGLPDADTVSCRLKYAGKARYAGGTELAAYCRQAGPGGDGRCGGNCEGFCDIAGETCTSETTAPYYYASRAACLSTCGGLPDLDFTYGNRDAVDGNSVECRLFHVMSAAMADPEEHCAHALGITLCEAPAP